MKDVYQRIKRIREKRGFTQEAIAKYLGIEQPSYNRIENAKTALTIENLYKIAEFLQVDISEILFGEKKSEGLKDYKELFDKINHLQYEIKLLEATIKDKERIINLMNEKIALLEKEKNQSILLEEYLNKVENSPNIEWLNYEGEEKLSEDAQEKKLNRKIRKKLKELEKKAEQDFLH